MTDAEKVELAIRRIAADPRKPEIGYWLEKLADELAKLIAHDKTDTKA